MAWYKCMGGGGSVNVTPIKSTTNFVYVDNFSGTDVRQLAFSYTATDNGKLVFAPGSYVNTNTGSNEGYLTIEVNGTEVYTSPALVVNTDTTLTGLDEIEVTASDVVDIYVGFNNAHSRCHFSIYTAFALVS